MNNISRNTQITNVIKIYTVCSRETSDTSLSGFATNLPHKTFEINGQWTETVLQAKCYSQMVKHHHHHHLCVAPLRVWPLVANSLQSGRFRARSTASVHDSPWESRSFCTVFIQVIRGRPVGLFQYTEGEEVKICLASTLSFIRMICPNRVRRRAWIISVSRGWLVWHRTSWLEIKQ